MKRRVVKMSFAILSVIGILLGLLVILAQDWGAGISFGFLDGRRLTARFERDPGSPYYKETHYVYSFEADINDIFAEANAELSALGYIMGYDNTQVPHLKVPRKMRFVLLALEDEEMTWVEICEEDKLSAYPTLKSPQYSRPGRNESDVRDDRVSVTVTRTRPRSWPPQYALRRLKRRLRRPSKETTVKTP